MYIKYNGVNYPCKCAPSSTMIYRGLPDDFPSTISGEISLCSDDGFVMRTDNVEDYLRYTFINGVLTLTNTPETEDVGVNNEVRMPTDVEQLRADIDYIAIMTGVEL